MKIEPFFGEHFKNVVNGVERRESVYPGKQPSVFLVPMIVVVECRHGAQIGANLLPEEFPQLFAQPVYRETLSRREELRSCISSPNHGIVTIMGDSNPKNTQKKKAQQSAKKVSGQKKPVVPSVPASGKRK